MKLKHLEIEWNFEKTSSFPTLAQKQKKEAKYQFEEQSKTTREAWKSKGTRMVELGEGQGLTKRYLKRHQRSNRTKKSVEKQRSNRTKKSVEEQSSTQAMKGVDE